MDNRSEARIGTAKAVRVFGMDADGHPFHHQATAMDISLHGARIEMIHCSGLQGQTVGIRFGSDKARYRVVWLGSLGSGGNQQVGLYCVDAGAYIWDVIPQEQKQISYSFEEANLQPRSALFQMESSGPSRDRRSHERVSISGSAQLRNCETNAADWAGLYDLSRNGCYLETRSPWPVATSVELTLDVSGTRIQAKAQVIASHPLVGMGLHFVELSRLNQQKLEQLFGVLQQHCLHEDGGSRDSEFQDYGIQDRENQESEISAGAVTLAQLISCRPDDTK
jgi:hypothetical protein